jgi:hypothetical protein
MVMEYQIVSLRVLFPIAVTLSEVMKKLPCRGICFRHKIKKPRASLSRYLDGQKRCQVCQIFMQWDGGIRCPCCNSKLRTSPRGGRHRSKLRMAQQDRDKQLVDTSQVIKILYI